MMFDTCEWWRTDDADGVLHTLKMIGGSVFATLNVLEKHGMLCADSPIKNLAFILGVLYENTREWLGDDDEPDLSWAKAMIRRAQLCGIEFKDAPYNIQSTLAEDGVADVEEKAVREWNTFNWKKEVS